MRHPILRLAAVAVVSGPGLTAAAVPFVHPAGDTEMPAPPPASPRLQGSEAWAAMLGNTIAGTTPDGDYAELFRPDGTFVHVDRDGKDTGKWIVKDQSVCFTEADDETECRVPELQGAVGAFTDADGTRYPFTLLPGNPKGL